MSVSLPLVDPFRALMDDVRLASPAYRWYRPTWGYRQAIWTGRLLASGQVVDDPEGLRRRLRDLLDDLTDNERAGYHLQLQGEANRHRFLTAVDGSFSQRGVCISRLLRHRCGEHLASREYACDLHAPPYADHSAMLIRGGKPRAYVTQPYTTSADREALVELQDFCDQHDLRAHVVPDLSWHMPGQTTLIIIHRRGVPLRGAPGEPQRAWWLGPRGRRSS